MNNDILKKRIMRRVYAIWVARKLVNPFSLKAVALLILLSKLREYVSVKHVLYNSPSFLNPSEAFLFFSHAFNNSERASELLSVAILAIGLWIAWDTARRFSLAERYSLLAEVRA